MKHNFENLQIWQRSMALVKKIYELSVQLPKDERFGLTSQIRRSAVSVPSNIAEGCGRTTNKHFSLFLDYSIGSLCELQTQLILASNLNLLNHTHTKELSNEISEIRKMIIGFQRTLRQD